MTATILLIRHAAHAHLGHTLSGRTAGGNLTAEGAAQAQRLARWLSDEAIAEIHTSPVLRARETAGEIAGAQGVDVSVVPALHEVDFGDWTGKSFGELAGDPAWKQWNENRGQARAPEGETMSEVEQRIGEHLRATAAGMSGKMIAMVSHCDTIRAAIAGVLGLSLDHLLRFEVAPASVSRIEAGDWGARLLSLNEQAANEQAA